MPKLLALLDAQAPGVQVQIKSLPADPEDALAGGDVDLMIGIYRGESATIYRRPLFKEQTTSHAAIS
jgi:DNA-binding transcriptional LysR family regulator